MIFQLSCLGDQATCRAWIIDALEQEGYEIQENSGNVVKAEGKLDNASKLWTSPLMRAFGRLQIIVSFVNPLEPGVLVSLNITGHIFQVISIIILGAITFGIGLVLFAFYPSFTDYGIKNLTQNLRSSLEVASRQTETLLNEDSLETGALKFETCPYCNTEVLPMTDGRCPNCKKNFT